MVEDSATRVCTKLEQAVKKELKATIFYCLWEAWWPFKWLVRWTLDRAVLVRALAGALRCVLN